MPWGVEAGPLICAAPRPRLDHSIPLAAQRRNSFRLGLGPTERRTIDAVRERETPLIGKNGIPNLGNRRSQNERACWDDSWGGGGAVPAFHSTTTGAWLTRQPRRQASPQAIGKYLKRTDGCCYSPDAVSRHGRLREPQRFPQPKLTGLLSREFGEIISTGARLPLRARCALGKLARKAR